MVAFSIVAGIASMLGCGISAWTLFNVYQIKRGYDFIIHAERAQRKLKALEQRFLHFQKDAGVSTGEIDAELRAGVSVLENLAERTAGRRTLVLKDAATAIKEVLDTNRATEDDYWRVYSQLTQVIEVVDDLVHSRKLEV